ncbi:MAG: DUF2027 domain-containing protein [Flavobacteriales bacterium]|nr:DUF2027 domain-containing protein [Flavobacteriales bacterium]
MTVGDRVRFLNHVGEATVIRILPNGQMEVEDEFGLVTTHAANELVGTGKRAAVVPVSNPVIDARTAQPEPVQQPPAARATAEPLPELALVFLAEVGSEPTTCDFELFFHNGSDYHLLVNIAAKEDRGFFSLYSGEVRAGDARPIRGIRRQDVDIFSITMVDCIFFQDTDYQHREAFSATVRLKPTRFVKPSSFVMLASMDGKAIVVPVERPAPKVTDASAGVTVRTGTPPVIAKRTMPVFDIEVDIHIEELTTEHRKWTPHEMLIYQRGHVQRHIERGLKDGLLSITFIHGIGKGRLRDEVLAMAAEYGLRCEAGAFHKYKGGATVVFMSRG